MLMNDFNIVVTRIPSLPDGLLVVPFNEGLEFNQRNTFTDSEFLVFLRKLGVDPNKAQATLERSRPAQGASSFALRCQINR